MILLRFTYMIALLLTIIFTSSNVAITMYEKEVIVADVEMDDSNKDAAGGEEEKEAGEKLFTHQSFLNQDINHRFENAYSGKLLLASQNIKQLFTPAVQTPPPERFLL